jgi:exodeoxyribonuclease III
VTLDTRGDFSVATWNVNSILAHETQVLSWLERTRPAVLTMQETQCSNVRFPRAGFAALGYELAVHGDGGSNGVAIASCNGLEDIRCGVDGALAPFNEPRIVSARIDSVRIVCAYAPNGRKVGTDTHRFKLAWFSFLKTIVEQIEEQDVVLLADLNVAPTDNDVWDAHRYRNRNLTSLDERSAFQSLLDSGLVDVVRAHSGNAKLSTWWNRRGDFFESDRGWRLDHVLATAGLAASVRSVVIDREVRRSAGGSDHAPVSVWFTSQNGAEPGSFDLR